MALKKRLQAGAFFRDFSRLLQQYFDNLSKVFDFLTVSVHRSPTPTTRQPCWRRVCGCRRDRQLCWRSRRRDSTRARRTCTGMRRLRRGICATIAIHSSCDDCWARYYRAAAVMLGSTIVCHSLGELSTALRAAVLGGSFPLWSGK